MIVGHYAPMIWAQGGIANYVSRLGAVQTALGHTVYYFGNQDATGVKSDSYIEVRNSEELFKHARVLGLDVLHLHKPVDVLPEDRVPVVRTFHGHQGSCPSGTRYLSRSGMPCNRAYSVFGCLWGHYVDRCGSRHPARVKEHFTRLHHEMRQASLVPTYTVSQYLYHQMVRSGCSSELLHTILSPAPEVTHPYRPPEPGGVSHFVFLGRLVPQKGLSWLLRAIGKVSRPVHLDVAGDGYERDESQRLAERLGIADRVTFHGWVEQSVVSTLILNARAVIFPSVWQEPAGLVSLEAAAHGRAVIASRVGGIPEYATEEYALLVEPNDVDGLADCIDRLASDVQLAEHLGRNGMELMGKRFSMAGFMDQLEAFYNRAIMRVNNAPLESRGVS